MTQTGEQIMSDTTPRTRAVVAAELAEAEVAAILGAEGPGDYLEGELGQRVERLTAELAAIPEPRKGLLLGILRSADLPDCSLNGVSARYRKVVVTGVRAASARDNASAQAAAYGERKLPRVFSPSDDAAEVELVVRWGGTGKCYVHAVPVEGQGHWSMFGGAYIETSDSRWGDMLRAIYGTNERRQTGPIPLHDRFER
jgi:hypothetical protein